MDNSTETTGAPAVAAPSTTGPPNPDLFAATYGWVISMTILGGLAVAARFYTRGKLMRVLGREDWCILVAWLFAIAVGVGTCFQYEFGLGSNYTTLTPHQYMLELRASWVTTLFYQLSLTFTKFSILFLYIRVLTYPWARRAAWGLLAIIVLYKIWGFASTFTLCIPLRAYWDKSITDAKCYGIEHMWAVIGLHIGTDFFLFALPVPVVWGMKLPLRQKIGLLFVFALGFFVCMIAIIRVVFILHAMSRSTTDPTSAFFSIAIWSVVEVHTAIVCACLVVLKPLIARLWPSLLGTAGSNNHDEENHQSPHRVLTIGSRPHRGGPSPQDTLRDGHLTLSSVSADKNSLCDMERKREGQVERMASANSLHHEFLMEEARGRKEWKEGAA